MSTHTRICSASIRSIPATNNFVCSELSKKYQSQNVSDLYRDINIQTCIREYINTHRYVNMQTRVLAYAHAGSQTCTHEYSNMHTRVL